MPFKSIVIQKTDFEVFFPYNWCVFFLEIKSIKTSNYDLSYTGPDRRANYGESEIKLEYLSHLNINGGVKAESHLFPS